MICRRSSISLQDSISAEPGNAMVTGSSIWSPRKEKGAKGYLVVARVQEIITAQSLSVINGIALPGTAHWMFDRGPAGRFFR